MPDFEEDGTKIDGLHFAKEILTPGELDIFYPAERMYRRVRAVLALHVPDTSGWKVGTPVKYMSCKGCSVPTVGGSASRLFDDCPTRAVLLAVS